jgi:hypothetical protein
MACSKRLLQCALSFLFPLMAQAAQVQVQIRLAAPDALEVSYALPAHCKAVPFLKSGDSAQTIRSAWQAMDGCASASGALLRRGKDACPALRFRVPATTEIVSGYPGSFPVIGGIYVHTSNYALAEDCGKVSYRFVAPGIATGGRAYEGGAEAQAGGDTPALLMQTPLAATGGTLAYFDPRLSPGAVAQIKEVEEGTISFLKAALPDAQFKPPILAAVVASAPGGPNVGGNGSDVLMTTFYNWPVQPGPAERAKMTLVVAHEFSHRFQMRDAVDVYRDSRVIHEGGAEFLRWLVSVQKGWLTHDEAVQDLDNALSNCMLYAGAQSWHALTPRYIGNNHLEYTCGLPAYVYALAARQGRDSALARFNDFYKDLRQGRAPDFAQAMECGKDKQCRARWFPALLDQDGPMGRQWDKLFRETGLAVPHRPNQAQRDAMTLQAIVKLMADDCGGKSSTTPTPDSILLDAMPVCKTIRANADVAQVEGQPVFSGEAALPALLGACAARHEVKLGLRNGQSLALRCSEPYQARTAFYGVDLQKVLANLVAK